MKYSLNAGEWNNVFAVPASIVDKYIKLADGKAIKLLLFLLRHGGESFSEEQLKKELGFRLDGELEDAAVFWKQRGVIRYDAADDENGCNHLSPLAPKEIVPAAVAEKEAASQQLTLNEMSAVEKTASSEKNSSVYRVNEKRAYYTKGEITQLIKSNSEIRDFFEQVEKELYRRPLNPKEQQSAMALVEYYGLPVPVAMMLLKYCFQVGKTTQGYIQKLAENWSEDEINTIELAEIRIVALERQIGIEEQLRTEMEFQSKFTAKQKDYIRVWTEDWGFGKEMIMLAYDVTVDAIGEMKFSYANKVLENWKAEGISNAAEVHRKNSEYKAKPKKARSTERKQNDASSFNVDDVLANIQNQYGDVNQSNEAINTKELLAQIRAGSSQT